MWKKKLPKIVIIEDDKNNRELFVKAFGNFDLDCDILNNAEDDFVEQILGLKPDIISMDLMIGDSSGREIKRDGFDAIKLLKSDKRTSSIPIVVLTSFFEGGKVEQAKSLGAVDYVSLQGQTIKQVPEIFLRYLDNPKKYSPVHPLFKQ
jgi:CheY-like chemotaxis protein